MPDLEGESDFTAISDRTGNADGTSALENWRPDNPARGQCGVTALVLQDLLGGDLVLGEVYVGQTKVGNHYWNRVPDGAEVDLTADQFHPGETVIGGQVQQRPPDPPRRCR